MLAYDLYHYLSHPNRDFTRKQKLRFKTIIVLLMGMGGGRLSKEIYEWIDYVKDTVSAFTQQRSEIKYEELNFIFKSMINCCEKHLVCNGYRLVAVDG